MIKFSNVRVLNFEGAIRGMRNPLESWKKSDSEFPEYEDEPILGENDLHLALKLATSGSDHGKFLRQIIVSFDLKAPLYWWKEFDTYKVGTVANSTSTMHKLGSRPLTDLDFSFNDVCEGNIELETNYVNNIENVKPLWLSILQMRENIITYLNDLINLWKNAKDKEEKDFYWREIIKTLPSSYFQTRTITLNYEVLRNIYFARNQHKLIEWHDFCYWIEFLPYSQLIITPRK